MARKRRLFIDEDLGRVVERISSDDDTPLDDEPQADYQRILARQRGLDARVQAVKASWRRLGATLPVADAKDAARLQAYAFQIPWRLSVLQNQVRHPSSTLEELVVFALMTGQAVAEGRFWLTQVPTLRLGRKYRARLRLAGQESGRERRERARESDADIEAASRTIRARHPHDRQHSTNWLATELSRKLRRRIGRSVLRRLGLE